MARKALINFRRDTAANWTSTNPTLAAGEPGWESDTNKLKIGDGSTAWNSLAYFSAAGSGVTSIDGISGAVTLHAGTNVTITDNSPSAGDIDIASSGGGGGSNEIGYTQLTSTVNITSTTESSGTTILSPGALTFDGNPVLVQFFAPVTTATVSGSIGHICLFEGSTEITRLAAWVKSNTTNQEVYTLNAFYRFTPTAGSHTYTVTAFVSTATGTPAVAGSSPGTAGGPPAFIRFSHAS